LTIKSLVNLKSVLRGWQGGLGKQASDPCHICLCRRSSSTGSSRVPWASSLSDIHRSAFLLLSDIGPGN
jgi:hypothetical protein